MERTDELGNRARRAHVARGDHRSLVVVAVCLGLYALLGGATSFCGWAFDVWRLTDWYNNGISIQPNATLCVMFSGAGVLMLALRRARWAGVLGAAVALIAGATLLEWISGASLGIDRLLMFGREWGRVGVVVPGRMGPPGSLCWTVLGIAIWLVSRGARAQRWVAPLALFTIAVSMLSLIGYVYGVDRLYALPRLTVIALQTATFIMAVSVGLLVCVPGREPVRTLLDRGSAGMMARRMLPVLVLAPILLGSLRDAARRAGWMDIGTGTALLVVGLLVLLLGAMWMALGAVRREEAERTRAQEEMRLSHQKFVELVERSPFGIYVVEEAVAGGAMRIVTMNAGSQNGAFRNVRPVIGRDLGEALGILWKEDVAAEIVARFRHTLETGEPFFSKDFVHRRGDIDQVEGYEWELHRIRMPRGVHGVICYYFDSTEMRRAERVVRESEERYRALVSILTDVAWTCDASGELDPPHQPVYEAYTGTTAEENRGGGWARAVHPDDRERVAELWRRACETRSPYESRGRVWHAGSGEYHYYVTRATPLLNPDGTVRLWVGSLTDIHQQVLAEEMLQGALAERTAEVRRAERAMAQSDRMAAVGTMASGLAHDITNVLLPLSARMDFVLAESGLKDEARTDLTVIVALVEHLREMARNLELFSRDPDKEGTQGTTELGPWCVRVKGLLESSLDGGARKGERRIRLTCDVPVGLPSVAIAPHRLTQAVLNLVHNARDAVVAARLPGELERSGGIVMQARAVADGSAVTLSVIDDGCGMNAEIARRCTEPFFTTKDRPIAAGSSGSGLGLSMAHAICERAGGRLEIESEPGKGTTVRMTLPSAASAAGAEGTAISRGRARSM